jgi:hypothetical protein
LIVTKAIQAHWQIQAKVDEIIGRLARDFHIVPVVQYRDEEISWDQECRGFGRVQWDVAYIVPLGDRTASDLIPSFNIEIDRLRDRFDLGVTCDDPGVLH